MLLLAASLSLSACVGGSGDFEVARTLPEPFGFSKYGPGCYKASTVPTAEPVPDLASWYRREMPERGYTKNYEEFGLTAGFQQEVCSKDLKAPNRWHRASGVDKWGRQKVEQVWAAAWEGEGIFCPTVWVTAWSTWSGDVYLHVEQGLTCLL